MLNILLIIIISIIKTIDTHIYSYPETNIQSRCGNIKHISWADSQVSQPMANTKAVQKLLSFLKRMWSAIWLLQGGQQSQPDTTVHASFILDLPYLAPRTSLCLSLII